MPEEFFDSSFAARMVRLLQLKRGRGPSFLSDEIVPVLDLTALLSNPEPTGPTGALTGSAVGLALAEVCFSRHCRSTPLPGVGFVIVLQVFNPVDSGRLVVIPTSGFVAENAGATSYSLRRHNTELTTVPAYHPLVGLAGRASVVRIREQVFALAAFPPAGAGSPLVYHLAGRVGIPIVLPILLRPGEGVIYYPSVGTYTGVNLSDPDPSQNTAIESHVAIMEL